MSLRIRLLLTVIWSIGVLGCSTPESQQRLNTVLCWLRPSCLPSHPSRSKTPSNASGPTKSKPPPKPIQHGNKPLPRVVQPRKVVQPHKCVTSAQTTVTSSKPFVTVSYVEPTTKADGTELTNLAKTTIYRDLGEGLVKYKDVPATNPQGGGTIKEKVLFTIPDGQSINATLCITATNINGQEG